MNKNSRAANACKISVLLLFSSILLGCNFAPSYQQPQDVVAATVPDATPAPALAPAVLAAAQADALQWLADDRLRHTVALALHNNRDLRIAADNVAKARAQYGIARAAAQHCRPAARPTQPQQRRCQQQHPPGE